MPAQRKGRSKTIPQPPENRNDRALKAAGLVRVVEKDPTIVVQLPYATDDNFTKTVIYPITAEAYLLLEAAEALIRVNARLSKIGYRLKIWDAYRPFSVQETLWRVFPNSQYVKKPVRQGNRLIEGSVHNRGMAVDITMVDSKTKTNAEMPTPFDEFSPRAHRDYSQGSKISIQNRESLQNAMEAEGFHGYFYEWWHFDYGNPDDHPLLDLPFH